MCWWDIESIVMLDFVSVVECSWNRGRCVHSLVDDGTADRSVVTDHTQNGSR